MRKLTLKVFMSMLLICSGMITNAQMYGKWIVSATHHVYSLEFKDDGIVYPPTEIKYLEESFDQLFEFSGGGFNAEHDMQFYQLGKYFGYNDQLYLWDEDMDNKGLHPEFQIINKPGAANQFFSFLTVRRYDGLDDYLLFAEIFIENNIPEISIANSILNGIDEHNYVSFAFGNEIDASGNRAFYVVAPSSQLQGSTIPAGIKMEILGDNGLVIDPQDVILTASDFPGELVDADFSAYNMEIKTDANGQTVLAWISADDVSCKKIFIYWPDLYNLQVIDLASNGTSRIGGIEFSSLDDEVIYASCSNFGLVSINYNTGTIMEVLDNDNYEQTYLQTAPDGNIYGVSNNGKSLCQINMKSGTFTEGIFTLPSIWEFTTYEIFDTKKYYILPENGKTTFDEYMSINCSVLNNTCTGFIHNGEAGVEVNGGYAPYRYCLYILQNDEWVEYREPFTTEDDYYEFLDLQEGKYKCLVYDKFNNWAECEFEITADEIFDVNIFEPVQVSTTWSGIQGRSYRYGFYIESGVELTITDCELYFGPEARILIEPGAKLIVDNSTLDYLEICIFKWRGIEVGGNIGSTQHDQDGDLIQGFLSTDYVTISNAENGVSVYTCNYVDGERRINWYSSGGVVLAKHTDFLNNARSVHFIPYQNYHPVNGYPMDNTSSFKICNFSIDKNYVEHTTFHKQVDLHGVNGIDFKGCIFTNTGTNGVSDYCLGIGAYGAGFTVEPGCTDETISPCPGYRNSSFSGFYAGVAGYTSEMDIERMNIWETDFQNNVIGVYNLGVDNATIVDCDFDIGRATVTDGECPDAQAFGIDIQEAQGFVIENNTFQKYNSAPLGVYAGIRAKDCPSMNDIIYLNYFDGLYYGNYAEGNNRSQSADYYGLEYRCNFNRNNRVDFIVTGEVTREAKIRDHMGNYDTAAGNTFSQNDDVKWHFNNEGEEVVSYYYYDQDPQIPNPILITPHYVEAIFGAAQNPCPNHYSGGEIRLSQSERSLLETSYSDNLNDYNSTLALFESLKDGGDTEAELMDVQMAQPGDMWDLRTQLLGDSPHLSQEVLIETSDRTDVFPDDVLFDILAANPDEIKQDSLLSYLENKQDPLPDYMIELLMEVASGNITYKTILRNQMADAFSEKTQAAQDILRSILNDSILDLTDYRNWLDNMSSAETDKQIISSYLLINDTVSAVALLNMIPALYDLNGQELDQFNDYKDLLMLQMDWKQSGKSIFELDSTELNTLEMYANGNSPGAKAMARGLLSYAYNYRFCDCMKTDSSYNKNTIFNQSKLTNDNKQLKIEVAPNPADTWIAFNYHLPSSESTALLKVSNAEGKEIASLNISGETGQQVIDTREFAPGVYFYYIISDGVSTKGKFIIR